MVGLANGPLIENPVMRHPAVLAKMVATIDHISGGRAGFNLVTTSNPDAALNFGMDGFTHHIEDILFGGEIFIQ